MSRKPVERVKDDTLILADQSEKAISQGSESVRELLSSKFPVEFGLPVRSDIPAEFMDLMALNPQPVRHQPTVEYLPERRHGEAFWKATSEPAFYASVRRPSC